MAYPIGSIQVTGSLGTTDVTDTYPTNLDYLGFGGMRAVVDDTARDAITTQRRTFGMLVFSVGSNKLFKLANISMGGNSNNLSDNLNWIEFAPGGVGVNSLNSLTGALTLTTGTSGSDFGITSVGSTITIDLPVASSTVTGKLSSTDWGTFNGKQNALGFTPVNKAGDTMTGNLTVPNLLINAITQQSGAASYSDLVIDTATGTIRTAPVITGLPPVLDNTITTPPTLPEVDDAYIVPAGATGAWSGQTNNIATWNGTAWVFYTPVANDQTTVLTGINAGKTYVFNGTAWIQTNVVTQDWRLGGNALTAQQTLGTTTNFSLPIITNGATRMTITNSGLVGIGITAPQARFHVSDTQSGTGALPGIFLAQSWNTTGNPTALRVNVTNTASGATSRLASFQIGGSDRMVLDKNGVLTVNSTSPSASAQLQVDSTTRGFLPPRMTTTERNAITSPAAGLVVYDSTLNAPYFYNGTAWVPYISPVGVTSLNSLTGGLTLTTGTTGTDFGITSVGSTITLNLPVASATNTGKLSSTDWSTFNNKQNALSFGNLTETVSSILTITGGTGAVIGSGTTIQVSQAGASTSGFLSSTDWNTFNNKLSPGTVWLLNGNTVGSTQTLGTLDNFDLPFITNNTERLRISNAGVLTAQNATRFFQFGNGLKLQTQASVPLITTSANNGLVIADGTAGIVSAASTTSIAHGGVFSSTAEIVSNAFGATASGLNEGSGSSIINAVGNGSTARGQISSTASAASITAGGAGSIASGSVDGTSNTITTISEGGIAVGVIDAGVSNTFISANRGLAIGHITGGTGGGIISNGSGAIASGLVAGTSTWGIRANGNGSLAMGKASGTNSGILSTGDASITIANNSENPINNDSSGSIIVVAETSGTSCKTGTPIGGSGNAIFGFNGAGTMWTGDSINPSTPTYGNMVQGQTVTGGQISTEANGSFARGYSENNTFLRTQSGADGSMASGYASTTTNPSTIVTNASGAHAFGAALEGGTISSAGPGSLACGLAQDGGTIAANDRGSFVSGLAVNAGAFLQSNAKGSFALGYTDSSIIQAIADGSFVFGYSVAGAGPIQSGGNGSLVGGYSSNSGALEAVGNGSLTWGYQAGAGSFSTNGTGCIALGYSEVSLDILGKGSFGGGSSSTGISLNGTGSFCWGDGINVLGDFNFAMGQTIAINQGTNPVNNSFAIGSNLNVDRSSSGLIGFNMSTGAVDTINIGNAVSNGTGASVGIGWNSVGFVIEQTQIGAYQKLLALAGDSGRAGFYLNPQVQPSPPALGDIIVSSTQNTIQSYLGSTIAFGAWTSLSGTLFTQTQTVTVGNTVTETNLSGTGIGTLTIPRNYLKIGKTIRINFRGYHSSISGTNGDLTIRIEFAGTTVLSGTIAGSNVTNKMFEGRADITCRTTGAAGTVFGQGIFCELGNTSTFNPLVATGGITSTTTINTTADQAITVTAQWASANTSNTISCTNLIVEILN